jgi:hypothetical protein
MAKQRDSGAASRTESAERGRLVAKAGWKHVETRRERARAYEEKDAEAGGRVSKRRESHRARLRLQGVPCRAVSSVKECQRRSRQ